MYMLLELIALRIGSDPLLAFPSVAKEEIKAVEGGVAGYVKALDAKYDPLAEMVRRAADK